MVSYTAYSMDLQKYFSFFYPDLEFNDADLAHENKSSFFKTYTGTYLHSKMTKVPTFHHYSPKSVVFLASPLNSLVGTLKMLLKVVKS